MVAESEEISLRPMSLRPGGAKANPFSAFGKGAGAALRSRTAVPTAPAADDGPKKPRGQIIKYSKEFLLAFMDRYNKCPLDLQQSQLEIVVSDEVERQTQWQSLQRVAEEVDDRDWRTRTPLPPPEQKEAQATSRPAPGPQQPRNQQQQTQQQQTQPARAINPDALRIQRAEDIGRQAYKIGGSLSEDERALRQIKGILNKLTPEKFERLLEQLLTVVTNAELLKSTITLVFENAVAQPTFCAMYADLCLRLSTELPSFPPAPGEAKPVSFKRVLLNTCQDEFEAAATAREELETVPAEERDVAEKKVRMRTLGTVRLIAELYRKDVVKETIIVVVVQELLRGKGPKADVPPEDNIESGCEMITICGKKLSESSEKKTRDSLEAYMHRLQRLTDNKDLSSRIRFIIRDVIDMRKNKWVPRRETFTAKKLEEVHAQAEAELGLVSSKVVADLSLPALPAQSRMAAEDFTLLPPLRFAEDGWEVVGKKGTTTKPRDGNYSALTGEYKAPEMLTRPAAAPAAAAAAAPAAAAAAAPKAAIKPAAAAAAKPAASKAVGFAEKPMSAEDVAKRAKSTFMEYVSVGDMKEALQCFQELRSAPKESDVKDLSAAVSAAINEVFDAQREKDETALLQLLVNLVKQQSLQVAEFTAGLKEFTSQLEDLSLDVPKAPGVLGRVLGMAAAEGAVGLDQLPLLLEGTEGAEVKRKLAAAAFKAVVAAGGEGKLKEVAAGLPLADVLKADEFDGDLPSVQDWAKKEGFAGALVL